VHKSHAVQLCERLRIQMYATCAAFMQSSLPMLELDIASEVSKSDKSKQQQFVKLSIDRTLVIGWCSLIMSLSHDKKQ
jgi:hypothetical protein